VVSSRTGASESQKAAPRQAHPPRRSEERPAPVRLLYDSSDRPDSDSLQRRRSPDEVDGLGIDAECAAGGGFWRLLAASAVVTYPGRRSPRCSRFPCRQWGPRIDPGRRRGRRISPQAVGERIAPLRRRIEEELPPSRRAPSVQPPSWAHRAARRRSPGCAPKCKFSSSERPPWILLLALLANLDLVFS
jgi:hypothetical protein